MIRLFCGNAATILRGLPSDSVHCCVTSPPYWGLRSYLDGGTNEEEIGLEKSFDDYLDRLVEVFMEVHRVLREDGTFWLIIGDRYIGKGDRGNSLQTKQLVGIPWRLAFRLQEAGWYLRSEIIWAKPNPAPESVRDRPCRAHETIFLLTKGAQYYYDRQALKEPCVSRGGGGDHPWNGRRYLRDVWQMHVAGPDVPGHYARFPLELPLRCIRLGSSERGCCTKCGAFWVREIEHVRILDGQPCDNLGRIRSDDKHHPTSAMGIGHGRTGARVRTLGWKPTCACNAAVEPCTVLDPFVGSGTTALAAQRLGRSCIGIDLASKYIGLAKERLEPEVGLWGQIQILGDCGQ